MHIYIGYTRHNIREMSLRNIIGEIMFYAYSPNVVGQLCKLIMTRTLNKLTTNKVNILLVYSVY